jgi:hypothetical protein
MSQVFRSRVRVRLSLRSFGGVDVNLIDVKCCFGDGGDIND